MSNKIRKTHASRWNLDPLAGVAAAITLALAVLLGPPISPIETRDTDEYVAVAGSFLSEWSQDRPPAYPIAIRICRWVAGGAWPVAMVWVQIGLLCALAAVLYRLLRRLSLRPELALATAVAACATPSLIDHSRVLLPEVLMAVLVALAWNATLRSLEDPPGGLDPVLAAALAGFWSGVAVLAKPVWLFGALPLALGILLSRQRPAPVRRRAALVLVAVHLVLLLSWQTYLFQHFGQRRFSRIGTVNLNLAAIRLGMTRYGAGTPLYGHLESVGLLDSALTLRFEDLASFNRIKDSIPDELRIDREFERETVFDHPGEFLLKQLPRVPAFFSTRPLDPDRERPGRGLLGALRSAHRFAYGRFFRVGIGSIALSPCLVLLTLGAVWSIRDARYRDFEVVSLLTLGSFVLLTVVLSFQNPTIARYRAEVEPVLMCVALLPLGVGAGRLVRGASGAPRDRSG